MLAVCLFSFNKPSLSLTPCSAEAMGSKRVLLQSNHGPMIAAESMDVAFDYLVCCAQCPDMVPCACTLTIAAMLLCTPAADKCRNAALSSCCSPHVSLRNQLCKMSAAAAGSAGAALQSLVCNLKADMQHFGCSTTWSVQPSWSALPAQMGSHFVRPMMRYVAPTLPHTYLHTVMLACRPTC